jgi:hypothetical protein
MSHWILTVNNTIFVTHRWFPPPPSLQLYFVVYWKCLLLYHLFCKTLTVRVYKRTVLPVMKFRVFWDVVPFSHIEVDRHFRGAPLKRHSAAMWLHGPTSQNSLNFILAAMRTRNLTQFCQLFCMGVKHGLLLWWKNYKYRYLKCIRKYLFGLSKMK